MFCDLVGSTALSARLDPEDLRGIIGAYHRCVAETAEAFSGYVAIPSAKTSAISARTAA